MEVSGLALGRNISQTTDLTWKWNRSLSLKGMWELSDRLTRDIWANGSIDFLSTFGDLGVGS